ncbi:MAG: hypothetical protein BAJATHORv1_20417 [Candidatus Thorarchaeota archaeon]|nr:MAG: hypothetical protein BAJATHORv1_20417 [Candidatus Thorarchaeota archaeon]
MPRLDVFLVTTGKFPSRQAAKRAIKAGHVFVNGSTAKPSSRVLLHDEVQIIDTPFEYPLGYSKMKALDEIIDSPLVSPGDLVLDIGSSAGGFLIYLLEHGANVVGIEYSTAFKDNLVEITEKFSSVSILFDDAFRMDPNIICESECIDFLVIDVTTDPVGTLKLIQRFIRLLRPGSRLIAAFKSKGNNILLQKIQDCVMRCGCDTIKFHNLDPSQQELHLVAVRR